MEACKALRSKREMYEKNPFITEGIVKRSRKKLIKGKTEQDSLLIIANGEEEMSVSAFLAPEKEVDSTQFLKLFVGGVKRLKELTSAGTKVFELLYFVMQENTNKDKLYLTYTESIKRKWIVDLSESTFHRGLSELIEKKFLAASDVVGWFWINPDFVWNGDRLMFIQAYRKKQVKEIVEKSKQLKMPYTTEEEGIAAQPKD